MAIGSPSTSTSSIRASAIPAGVLPTVHQGSRLNPGASKPSSEGGSRTSPSVSGFLQPSLPRPEGFGVVAPHHRSVDPERLHHLVALPHGDSSVSPEFHPPRRLDDLPGPAGRIPRVVKKTVFFISCFFQEKNVFFSGKKHVFFVFFFSFFFSFFSLHPISSFLKTLLMVTVNL